MHRSLLALLKDTAPAILPLLARMITFSQQSCCYFSQLKDYPLLTSHPLSSHCSISLLPFLAKPSQRFLYSVFPESSLLRFSNSLLSGLPSLLHSCGLAYQTNAQFLVLVKTAYQHCGTCLTSLFLDFLPQHHSLLPPHGCSFSVLCAGSSSCFCPGGPEPSALGAQRTSLRW